MKEAKKTGRPELAELEVKKLPRRETLRRLIKIGRIKVNA